MVSIEIMSAPAFSSRRDHLLGQTLHKDRSNPHSQGLMLCPVGPTDSATSAFSPAAAGCLTAWHCWLDFRLEPVFGQLEAFGSKCY
jgi:hypothetical protein